MAVGEAGAGLGEAIVRPMFSNPGVRTGETATPRSTQFRRAAAVTAPEQGWPARGRHENRRVMGVETGSQTRHGRGPQEPASDDIVVATDNFRVRAPATQPA
jgi:hypothetical protein